MYFYILLYINSSIQVTLLLSVCMFDKVFARRKNLHTKNARPLTPTLDVDMYCDL